MKYYDENGYLEDYRALPPTKVEQIQDEMEALLEDQIEFSVVGSQESRHDSYSELRDSLIEKARREGLGLDVDGKEGITRGLLNQCDKAGIEYKVDEIEKDTLEGCELAEFYASHCLRKKDLEIISVEVYDSKDKGELFFPPEEGQKIEDEGYILQYGPEEMVEDPILGESYSRPEMMLFCTLEEDGLFLLGSPLDDTVLKPNRGGKSNEADVYSGKRVF